MLGAMSASEDPAALPAAGDTTPAERTDPRTPDASGTVLTIQEAAKRYAVSVATLRRRLEPGGPGIPGAYKAPGPKGERWQIPIAALEAAGYRPAGESLEDRGTPAPAPQPEVAAEMLAELRAAREMMAELYRGERARLEAAEADRIDARREAAELAGRMAELEARHAAEMAAERAKAEQLATELEAAKRQAEAPRGLFRRRRS